MVPIINFGVDMWCGLVTMLLVKNLTEYKLLCRKQNRDNMIKTFLDEKCYKIIE